MAPHARSSGTSDPVLSTRGGRRTHEGDLAPVGPDVVISDRHHQRLLPNAADPYRRPSGTERTTAASTRPFSHPCARGAAVHQNKIRLGIVPPPQPLQLRRAPRQRWRRSRAAAARRLGRSAPPLRRAGAGFAPGEARAALLGQGRLPGHSTHQLDVPRLLERPQPARDLSLRNAQSDRGVRQRPSSAIAMRHCAWRRSQSIHSAYSRQSACIMRNRTSD